MTVKAQKKNKYRERPYTNKFNQKTKKNDLFILQDVEFDAYN